MARPVIDLFAGCGGFGLGLELAGFQAVYVNELHPDALSTYLLNHRGQLVDRKDRHSNDILDVTQRCGELATLASSYHSHPTQTGREAGSRHMACAAGVSSGSSRGDAGASTRRAERWFQPGARTPATGMAIGQERRRSLRRRERRVSAFA